MGELPPAWRKCPRKSEIIQGKFLAFKTPLDQKFSNQLRPEDTFTPEMVIASMKAIKTKIGLWIDLTNTNRYYNKTIVEKNGVNYFKLPTRGHKQAPTLEETRLFVNICHNFISKNPLSIIAVHCTHGFNRTGFLICAYLIEQFDWAVDAALSTFATCRPTGIYKEDYIKELFSRYGDLEDMPSPPMRPEWRLDESNHHHYQGDHRLNENDYGQDDDDRPQASNNNHSNHQSVLRKTSEFVEGIGGVEFVSDARRSKELQEEVRKMCNFELRGFPGAQPVSMSNGNLIKLAEAPYQVSWKADGTRYMMLIKGKNQVFMFDRDFSVFEIVDKCPKFPKFGNPDSHITALLDGEMVIDEYRGVKCPRYLIYDIIKFNDKNVGQENFLIRSKCIEREIFQAREEAKIKGLIDRNQELFGIRKKQFYDISATHKLLHSDFLKSMTHEVDGLIFQPVSDPYEGGQCPNILKWKPHTHNSIDFRVRIIRKHDQGCLPETIASLRVGREDKQIGQMKATREFREADNKIVECTWDYEQKTWKFMRIRTDKSFPNSFDTAASVWETMMNPLTEAKLLTFIRDQGYRSDRGIKRPHDQIESNNRNRLV